MGIDARHPLYKASIARWERCRAVFDGEDAVKAAGKIYLPKPEGLSDNEYKAYVERALFYEAVGRTIDGFVGANSRKSAKLKIPEKLSTIVEDATLDGLTVDELTKRMCSETILQGRGGLLVDYDDAQERPLFAFYRAEDITNWGADFIVLYECVYEPDPKDRFTLVATEQYRELSLIEGVYTVQLWRKAVDEQGKAKNWAPYGPPVIPKRRGRSFDTIPWQWLTPMGRTSRIDKPPLLGLVNVCISHYRTSADLEHGRHFTGLPTLYITGVTDPEQAFHIGATSAITLPDANSKVGYAEFSGQGLASLETAIEQKQGMMAVLGASVFHDSKRGVEAAETARIRTSGETSLLSGVVTAVEETLKASFAIAAEWVSASGEIEVTLNREFVDAKIDGPTLTALVQAYQSGAMTIEQFLFNLQQGEMLSPETDLGEEAAKMIAERDRREKAEQAETDRANGSPGPG